jgi:6-pyruvoyltetrahydropterin/6-carboxytetrahydropterin synthase
MSNFQSTKSITLGSCAFRQPNADSHCRWLHGYNLQAKFWFGCNELDINNWVVDFGALKGLKKKLEDQFDHTTCIDASDPILPVVKELASSYDAVDLRVMDGVGIEKFAEWCFDVGNHTVNSMTKSRCWVDRVEVWEHENNSAAYTRNSREIISTQTDDDRQQELDLRLDHGEPVGTKSEHPSGDEKQHKTKGKWVDQEQANKPNSWMF